MSFYTIYHADNKDVDYIKGLFPIISELSQNNQTLVCDAYITVLKNSSFKSLEEVCFSKHSTHYSLYKHINEVVEFSLLLANKSKDLWTDSFTNQYNLEDVILLALLHDLDKVLLLDEKLEEKGLNKKISHGYLSALILKDLGLEDRLLSLIAYHSPSASMHIVDPLAMILHYADLYSCVHIYMLVDRTPYYAK